MGRNLVRECIDLQLDRNQRKRFQKGDAVEILSGSYRGVIGRVVQCPTRSDPDHVLIRVAAVPYDTVIRLATNQLRSVQPGGAR